ncbi:hypothetical protein PAHAL_7G091400 [Panicum hallii]|uniref:Uncharacterized protein n=1 Tax=Panicum hallii TaxID=206008 RepID=A0A2T8IBJ7_9POAL|nr:hypothetical protein PAHAL_7G091400 [Panicum hallii]
MVALLGLEQQPLVNIWPSHRMDWISSRRFRGTPIMTTMRSDGLDRRRPSVISRSLWLELLVSSRLPPSSGGAGQRYWREKGRDGWRRGRFDSFFIFLW